MANKARKKAVLFDLDGTLTDSLQLIRHTYARVFEEMGIPWGNDDVMGWIGRPLSDIADHFAGGERAESFIDRYQHHYHRDHDRYMALFPGTLEILKWLREKGLKAGVVTSKGRPGTERTIQFTGMENLLDVVVTAHDVERHKPLPDPVLKALNMLGISAAEAVFVGDSHYDLEAGKAAGVDVLGVGWGISQAGDLMRHHPQAVLNHWEELAAYI